jgi:uncharacterized FAD-dependent dehydrogenase
MSETLNLRVSPDESLELASFLRDQEGRHFSEFRVLRRSIDARAGRPLKLQLRVELRSEDDPPFGPRVVPPVPQVAVPRPQPVLILGAGPAGLFCALELALHGVPVRVLEQGQDFPGRHLAVRDLRYRGELDPSSNYRFGLGGAGTYSDGKLHSRVDSPWVKRALGYFAHFANDFRVLVDSHPHLGSNKLIPMLQVLRAFLEALGVRFQFQCQVQGVAPSGLGGAFLTDAGPLEAPFLVLAPGNGARPLFEALAAAAIPLEAKPFAVGFRVEHPRALIDHQQFGPLAGHPALGAAEYRVAHQLGDRAVYSFCMCPGGQVLPTSCEPERLCVNGASHSHRNSPWSNAAMVVNLEPSDTGPDLLSSLDFLRRLEEAAFLLGGKGYHAPAQRLTDFLGDRPSRTLPASSYRPGLCPADLRRLLPQPLTRALKGGLQRTCGLLRGYDHPDAILIGVETSTSSPLRILRDPDGASPGHPWLFPCGEGSGYAGGISSSAGDGLRTAHALLRRMGAAPEANR